MPAVGKYGIAERDVKGGKRGYSTNHSVIFAELYRFNLAIGREAVTENHVQATSVIQKPC